jgi:hypothetical protein
MSSVSEKLLEHEITAHLLAEGGYRACKVGTDPQWRQHFDTRVGLDTVELLAFIEETQPEAWGKLVKRTAAKKISLGNGSSSGWLSSSTSAARSMFCGMAFAIRT